MYCISDNLKLSVSQSSAKIFVSLQLYSRHHALIPTRFVCSLFSNNTVYAQTPVARVVSEMPLRGNAKITKITELHNEHHAMQIIFTTGSLFSHSFLPRGFSFSMYHAVAV